MNCHNCIQLCWITLDSGFHRLGETSRIFLLTMVLTERKFLNMVFYTKDIDVMYPTPFHPKPGKCTDS